MKVRTRFVLAVIAASLLGQSFAASPIFFQQFGDSSWKSSFKQSTDSKYSGELVAEVPEGLTEPALKVTEKARHYGYAANIGKEVDPSKGLVLQFELKLADGLTCGGAYLKFLTASAEFDASGLVEDTPYVVMFGPDKCGATNKVHLIIKHKNPSGEIEEKHLKAAPMILQDADTHVYTAILNPAENTYDVLIDGESKKSGSLFDDFEPPFNPPEEIDDPEDKKPSDWVDDVKIPDSSAVKPDDWDEDAPQKIEDLDAEKPEGWLDDEPAEITDPEAEKPDDWDDEEDGEWEAPTIPNPACTDGPGCGLWKRPTIANPDYKGKWTAPLIDNPAYKGPWSPRKIANPGYFLDETPLANIGKVGGVAIEIWTMDNNYYFSNILIDNDPAVAAEARSTYWEPKKALEAKAAEEAAAKAQKEEESVSSKGVSDYVLALFDLPGLSLLKGPLEPLLDIVEDNAIVASATALGLLALPLFVLYSLLPKSKGKAKKPVVVSTTTVRESKKEDKPTADDKAAAAATSEIVEEEEDDEGKKNVRRRARRD
jgi:calnexin